LSPVSPQITNPPQQRAGSKWGWLAPTGTPYSLESLAAAATILGTVVSVLALVQSRAWLVLTSLIFVCVSIIAGLSARRERRALDAASVMIEGHSIDSLNIANLRRRVNRTFVIQEAQHTARIEDEDLKITWMYSGYCRAERESAIEFSIDVDDSTSFDRLDCIAYDLGRDPDMAHEIRPFLVGTEGISKKISVPFLEPLNADQPFSVLLKCTLPGCIKPGFGYYTSTLSFAQDRVRCCVVRLIFVGLGPYWMRVYESTPLRRPRLVKNLAPLRQDQGLCEYLDVVEDRPGRSARIYTFWRDSI
jgi:hypothetical protein